MKFLVQAIHLIE